MFTQKSLKRKWFNKFVAFFLAILMVFSNFPVVVHGQAPEASSRTLTAAVIPDIHVIPQYMWGDVNNDGAINLADVTILRQYLVCQPVNLSPQPDDLIAELTQALAVYNRNIITLRAEQFTLGQDAMALRTARADVSAIEAEILQVTLQIAEYTANIETVEAEISRLTTVRNTMQISNQITETATIFNVLVVHEDIDMPVVWGQLRHNGNSIHSTWLYDTLTFTLSVANTGDEIEVEVDGFNIITHVITSDDIASGEVTIVLRNDNRYYVYDFMVSVFIHVRCPESYHPFTSTKTTLTHNGVPIEMGYEGWGIFTLERAMVGDILVAQAPGMQPVIHRIEPREIAYWASIMMTETYPIYDFVVRIVDYNTGFPVRGLILAHDIWLDWYPTILYDYDNTGVFNIPSVIVGDIFRVIPSADDYWSSLTSGMVSPYAVAAGELVLEFFSTEFFIDPPDGHVFQGQYVGYTDAEVHIVTITNFGHVPTGLLSIALSGSNADSFELGVTTLPSLSWFDSSTFTISPTLGLAAGTHTATVTISNDNGIFEQFDVSFTVWDEDNVYAEDIFVYLVDEAGYRISQWVARSLMRNGEPVGWRMVSNFNREFFMPVAVVGDVLIADVPGYRPVTHIIDRVDIAAGEITIVMPEEHRVYFDAEVLVFGASNDSYDIADILPGAILIHNGINVPFVYVEDYGYGFFFLNDVLVGDTLVAQAPGFYPFTHVVSVIDAADKRITIRLYDRYQVSDFTVRIVEKSTGLPIPNATLTHICSYVWEDVLVPRNSDGTFTVPSLMVRDFLLPGYGDMVSHNLVHDITSTDIAAGEITMYIYPLAIHLQGWWGQGYVLFPEQEIGYEPLEPETVFVFADGWFTGPLTIELTGVNTDSFVLTNTEWASQGLGPDYAGIINVVPIQGLLGGTYNATISVLNDNGVYGQIDVFFTVIDTTPGLWTVIFDINGGKLVSGDLVQIIDHETNATPPIVEREGYSFIDWNPTGGYTNITGDITLTAIWEQEIVIPGPWTVIFDINGGELVSGDLVQTIDHETNATPPIVEREGYSFIDWNPTGGYTNITGDITLTAIWTAIIPLPAPTGLAISDNMLTWNMVAGAVGYRVYVNELPRTNTIAVTSFNLANLGLSAGTHAIQVRALGDGTTTHSSSLSSAVNFIIQQLPPDDTPSDDEDEDSIGGFPPYTPSRPPVVEPPTTAPQVVPDIEIEEPEVLLPPHPEFEDVNINDWFYGYVVAVVVNGLFNGISETHFAPNYNMTRAMFIQVLANHADADLSIYRNAAPTFHDVSPDAWYFAAVEWAARRGIVIGIGDGYFAQNAPITREQMATVLYRYADFKRMGLLQSGGAIVFADQTDISYWALESVNAMQRAGMMIGRPDGTFGPQVVATRAEATALFARFLTVVVPF